MARRLLQLIIVVFCAVSSQTSLALTFEIHARNQDVTTIDLPPPAANSTVGVVSVNTFRDHKIPFEGSTAGISSIYGQGSELEVIDNKRLKAWGWCFALDSVISDQMPDHVNIPENTKILKWFYAYALYDSGTWTGYCIQDQ